MIKFNCMKIRIKWIARLALVSFALSLGCQRANPLEPDDVSITAAAEAAVVSLGGIFDEVGTGNFEGRRSRVACDGRAAEVTQCPNHKKTRVYSGCTLGTSRHTLSGVVYLEYTDGATCALGSDGDSVVRTANLVRTAANTTTYQISSSLHSTYDGVELGEGARITKTSAGHNLDLLGHRRMKVSNSEKTVYDISIATTPGSPLILTGGMTRPSRKITDGSFKLYHNTGLYSMTFTPSAVTYANDCCYPVSGSFAITYAGTINGTGTLTFTGCGAGTITRTNLENAAFQFTTCE